MKKTTVILTILFFVLPLQCLFCQDEGTPVVIHETIGEGQGTPPKAPAQQSIFCILYENTSTLAFSFSEDLGTAQIIVENQTTHVIVFDIVNTNTGSTLLHIPSLSGIYSISIILSNNAVYYGEFEI